jgi:hypothetical protein
MLAAEDLAAQRAVAAPTWRHDDRVLRDTTAERTLAELGLWNPTTGYGFEKPLALVRGFRLPNFEERTDPSQLRLIPSAIQVLKLHGSCGGIEGARIGSTSITTYFSTGSALS